MDVIGGLIGMIIVGAIVGVIARFLVPGPDPMGWLGTIVLGVIGAILGGFLLGLIVPGGAGGIMGWIGAVVGAILVLLAWRQFKGRRGATV